LAKSEGASPAIEVRRIGRDEPFRFEVTVREGGGETRHDVTMTRAMFDQLASDTHTAERCIEAAFRFLLDREPKESILRRFDISVIARYFPEFPRELPRYFTG
jgi:hypothetical protein